METRTYRGYKIIVKKEDGDYGYTICRQDDSILHQEGWDGSLDSLEDAFEEAEFYIDNFLNE